MKYQHYPAVSAVREYEESRLKMYKVRTINWTTATVKGKAIRDFVHKNRYFYTLPKLIKFIRETEEVAEDVIDIQPIKRRE